MILLAVLAIAFALRLRALLRAPQARSIPLETA